MGGSYRNPQPTGCGSGHHHRRLHTEAVQARHHRSSQGGHLYRLGLLLSAGHADLHALWQHRSGWSHRFISGVSGMLAADAVMVWKDSFLRDIVLRWYYCRPNLAQIVPSVDPNLSLRHRSDLRKIFFSMNQWQEFVYEKLREEQKKNILYIHTYI